MAPSEARVDRESISINIDRALADRLRRFRHDNHISVSSIAEVALQQLPEGGDDESLVSFLKSKGAKFRRSAPNKPRQAKAAI